MIRARGVGRCSRLWDERLKVSISIDGVPRVIGINEGRRPSLLGSDRGGAETFRVQGRDGSVQKIPVKQIGPLARSPGRSVPAETGDPDLREKKGMLSYPFVTETVQPSAIRRPGLSVQVS